MVQDGISKHLTLPFVLYGIRGSTVEYMISRLQDSGVE
jgi:hypothetical protein